MVSRPRQLDRRSWLDADGRAEVEEMGREMEVKYKREGSWGELEGGRAWFRECSWWRSWSLCGALFHQTPSASRGKSDESIVSVAKHLVDLQPAHLDQLKWEAFVEDAIDPRSTWKLSRVNLVPGTFNTLVKVYGELLHHPAGGDADSDDALSRI